MSFLKNKKLNIISNKYLYIVFFFIFTSLPISYVYATLSCSITTSAACSSGVVMLRISDTPTSITHGYNAHAEIPSLSNSNYNNYVVCCNGVSGLGNSCAASNNKTIVRLSGTSGTNAHVEQSTQTNTNYNTQKVCLSSTYAGDDITIGYQSSNCTGYDTTLFSMSSATTNSQVGIPTAYNNKVCAKVFSQSITFNISATSAGFGSLNPNGIRYATPDGVGSNTETESYSLGISTNAPYGYIVMMSGGTLTNGPKAITAIGGTPVTPSAGSKAFGIRAIATGGIGAVASPYNASGFAYNATGTTYTTLASASSGDGNNTNYSVHSVATIDSILDPGSYSTNLTYTVTANF
ncbi:MAG: hypothetical protein WCR20_01235 [Verrucomicrobiota bacterium]